MELAHCVLRGGMLKLYQYKSIKYGFIILCPNCNFGHLKNTLNSINAYYPNSKIAIIVPDDCVENYPKAIKGGSTIASMINAGLKEPKCAEWNFVVCAEGWLKNRIDIKYSYFIESNKDILFPVLKTRNTNYNFANIDVNGMLIHKNAISDVGDFPNIDMETSKIIWTTQAIEKGYKFKGVVGGRLF